ncbi:hypothetical protein Tco_1296544, partial [Tanacetum coccineum]
VLDAIALTLCYSAFLTTADVPEVYMHQFWNSIYKYENSYRFRMDKKKKFDINLEIFKDIFHIYPRVHGQNFDELPTDEDIVSFFKELVQILWGMYYKKNVDYVELLWEDFTYQIDNRGITPPKKALKFKKHASPKLSTVLVSSKEPTRKDTPMMSSSKKKEKVTVEKRKGIELLSEVALTEEAQFEEVRKKSLRDFHKTHLSGTGIVTSAVKIKPSVTNKGTGAKPWVSDVTEEESIESEAKSWGKDKDDSNNDHDSKSERSDQERDSEENEEEVKDDEEEKDEEFVKTPSNSTDDEDETNKELKVEDKAEGDEDKGMDYTTNQFDDDVNVRLNEPVDTDEGFIQKKGTNAEMINVQQGNENPKISINQVIEDAYVIISTVSMKTEVLVTSSSHLSDLASKFLNFLDIPHTDAEIVSPLDVSVHHEVPSNQTPTLLTVPVLVITESSPIYTTVILQSLPSFTPPLPKSTPTPPTTTEATNPLYGIPNFAFIFQFNDRVSALEKDVAELKRNDPLNTQVTTLVDEHLNSRLGSTKDEFMSYLSASITARITDLVTKSLKHAVLAKESSQPKSTYEAASLLTEFELKKILIDKMDEIQSYLIATEHRECYDGLIKSYDLDKSLLSTYDKVYSLKRNRKDKDKDEDPSAGSDRGLKKTKTSKDAELITGPKTKESKSGSSKGAKSQSKSSGMFIQSEELEFEVTDSDMPQDQEENPGNDNEEPKGKTLQQGPTQSWLMTLASSADKLSKTFDELMSTLIDFSAYIMNGLKITNLTQETLLGPAFKLLKGIHTNFAELEYDFEDCYKALSEKLDWGNPEGGDYPIELTKPLPLVMNGNRQMVPVDYFFNNDLKYLQGGISTMTYTTSITKTNAA